MRCEDAAAAGCDQTGAVWPTSKREEAVRANVPGAGSYARALGRHPASSLRISFTSSSGRTSRSCDAMNPAITAFFMSVIMPVIS